jgi:hypothetical protein
VLWIGYIQASSFFRIFGHQILADLLRLAGVTEKNRQRLGDVCGLPTPGLKVTPGIKKRIEVNTFANYEKLKEG